MRTLIHLVIVVEGRVESHCRVQSETPLTLKQDAPSAFLDYVGSLYSYSWRVQTCHYVVI